MRLVSYYLQIVLPLPLIYLINQILHKSDVFVLLLLLYALFYRGLTDGFKLQRLGLLKGNELWKMFIPFSTFRLRYFHELYFVNK
jgi:hypothetical protein